jgi:hypothetical protein
MRGAVHMQITTIGLDIAKNVFQVHGIDAGEKVVVRKQLLPLLRARHPWPRSGRSSKACDEIAPSHCLSQELRTTPNWASNSGDQSRKSPPAKQGSEVNLRCETLEMLLSPSGHNR